LPPTLTTASRRVKLSAPFHPGILREGEEEPDGLQKIYFLIGVCLVQK
jgi:hypothetical protein